MKNNITIQKLRKSGAKVRVIHLRRIGLDKRQLKQVAKPTFKHLLKGKFKELGSVNVTIPQVVLATGGQTIIEVDTKDGNFYSASTITSRKDTYKKKAGVKICLDRLIFQMKQKGENI